MYSAYRRVTNSLSIPSEFFPRYPPYCTAVKKSQTHPTMLLPNHGLNEFGSPEYCVGVMVFTSLPLLTARGKVALVGAMLGEWRNGHNRSCAHWCHEQTNVPEAYRTSSYPPLGSIHVWAQRVTEQLPRLWLVKGQFAGLLLGFSFRP
jgi:hypothetical protein